MNGENDIQPYLKVRKNSKKPKIFLLFLVVASVLILVFVIYKSTNALFSAFEQTTGTSAQTHAATLASTSMSESVTAATQALPSGARPVRSLDMSAFTKGVLYENESDIDIFPATHEFEKIGSGGVCVLVICSRPFQTYLAEESAHITGAYPGGKNTQSVDICAKNISACLNAAGIGALFADTGNTSAYKCYENASRKIAEYIALYPDIKYVIDVTRGVYLDGNGDFIAPSFVYGGKETAQTRFEIGAWGAELAQSCAVADTLFFAMQRKAPLSVMPTKIKAGKLCSADVPIITVSIGGAATPSEQALAASSLFSEVLAELLTHAN